MAPRYRGIRQWSCTLAHMSEPRPELRTYWQVIDSQTAVKWEAAVVNGETVGIIGPAGLVMYGYVDFAAIRGIPLSTLTGHREGYPELDQADAPTRRQVEEAWKRTAAARARADKRVQSRGRFAHRRKNESADDFYRRVAEAYTAAHVATGTPTLDIASRASVPRTTAARWVREARARGFLATTKRGKGRS